MGRLFAVLMGTLSCARPAPSRGLADGRVALAQPYLLKVLQARRAEVATARPEDHVDRGRDLDLSPLLGLSQADIRRTLGTPDGCGTEAPVDGHCNTGLWEYDLYHLPKTAVGGGTEIVLEFTGGRCTFAAWSGSK
jgi:hypothetical protein